MIDKGYHELKKPQENHMVVCMIIKKTLVFDILAQLKLLGRA